MMERAQGEPRQTNVTNLHVAVPVWSNDAIRVGDVSHIVVDPRRCTIQQLVVRLEGERAAERLVMVSQLEAVHDDKVVLRLAAREVDHLPQFARDDYALVQRDALAACAVDPTHEAWFDRYLVYAGQHVHHQDDAPSTVSDAHTPSDGA